MCLQKLFWFISFSPSETTLHMFVSRKRFHDLNVPLCVKISNWSRIVILNVAPQIRSALLPSTSYGTPRKHAWKILTYCWPDLMSIEIAWDQMEWRNSPHSQFPRNALIKSCRCSASLCLDSRPVCHSLSKDTMDVKKNIITLYYNIIIFR